MNKHSGNSHSATKKAIEHYNKMLGLNFPYEKSELVMSKVNVKKHQKMLDSKGLYPMKAFHRRQRP